MMEPSNVASDRSTDAAVSRVARLFAGLAVGTAMIALAGWLSGHILLAAGMPAYIPMAPLTAIAILILGASALLRAGGGGSERRRLIIRAMTALVGVFAGLIIMQFVTGLDVGLERLMVSNPAEIRGAPIGRMSPLTASMLLIGACSLFVGAGSAASRTAGGLGLGAASTASVILLGYAYRAPLLYGGSVIPVALPTALALLLLGCSLILAAGPRSWPLREFLGPSIRAQLTRAILPMVLVIIAGFQWAEIAISRSGRLNAALGAAMTGIAALVVASWAIVAVTRHAGDAVQRTQDALAESEERFSSAFAYAPIGIALVSPEGRWLRVNQAVCDLLGHTEEEILARDFQVVTHPDDLAPDLANVRRTLQGEISSYQMQKRYFHKSGRIVWALLSVSLVRDAEGAPRHFISQIVDLTEQLKTAEELRRKNDELERFTYTVSHDLKSPLITIKGFVGTILEDLKSGRHDRLEGDLARVGDAADKMADLLSDLLELSRAGRAINASSDVDFRELVDEVLGQLAGTIRETGASIVVHEGLPVVRGDRVRLKQVVQNLVENALRFSPATSAPRVEIGWRTGEDGPTLFVRDSGIGIDPRYHQTVFGLFNKLDARSDGTGIGLALAHRIIELHQGKIWVESEGSGKGATFVFTLPAIRPAAREV